MVAFSAVSYRSKAGEKPALGTVKFEADTKVAVSDRLVNFQAMKIAEANFQTLEKEQVREITAAIDQAIPDDDRVIALDRVLANLDKSQIVPKNVEGIKADPPTDLLQQDAGGDREPRRRADLESDQGQRSEVRRQHELGPLSARADEHLLPAQRGRVAEGDRREGPVDAGRDSCPTASRSCRRTTTGRTSRPTCRASRSRRQPSRRSSSASSPAELILLTGEPSYRPVKGTELLWVSNTESDVFRMGKTGPVYYLVAGRWFSAPDFAGPWTFATPSLPADFKKIPLEHERSRVLASVPGTDQAAEAVLLAQIPQTARVNKKEVKAPDVAFKGDPQFAPIETTTVQRAVNTDKDVFKIGESLLHVLPGRLVRRTGRRPGRGRSQAPCRRRSTRSLSALQRIT